MVDTRKTKVQLVEEVAYLRRRVQELEAAEAERRWAEAVLRDSVERFELAVQGSSDGLWDARITLDEAGRYLPTAIYYSPRFRELLGFRGDEQENTLASWQVRLHPEDAPCIMRALHDHLIKRVPYNVEYRMCTASGAYRWFSGCGQALWDEQGRPVRMAGSVRDITEQKQVEETLRRARDELEQRMEERTATLARVNAQLRQEIAERKRVEDALRHQVEFETLIALLSKHFLNLPPQEIDDGINYALRVIGEFAKVDRSYLFLFTDEKKTRLDNTHEWCASGITPQRQHLQKVPVEAIPWWMRQLNQLQTIHIPRVADLPEEAVMEKRLLQAQEIQSLMVVPITSGGTLCGFLGFDAVREEKAWRPESAQLLTMVGEIFAHALARRQADKALQEREEQFRQLAENIREVFWMSVPGMSQVIYVSPTYEEIWGRTRASLYAEPRGWLETIHPEDWITVHTALKKQHEGELTDVEYRILRPDGTVRWVWDRSFPVRNTQGEIYRVVGVAEDITERKRVEASLREAKEAAEAANRAKTEFLATMSHELRTPLHIVLGYTDLMLDEEFGSLSDRQKTVLRRVRKNARVLQDLITAVLEISHLEAGQLPVNRRQVHVAPLLAEVEVELQDLIEQSGLAYTAYLADDLPTFYSDPDKLKVILKNLIGNAVKFTERGKITVAAYSREDGVEVSVADTGIGIPAEILPRIFEPFYQGDSSSTRLYGGAGLGLYIVKRLVELLGGTIAVESEVGHGSTFRVWLPSSAGLRIPVFDLRQGQWVLQVKE